MNKQANDGRPRRSDNTPQQRSDDDAGGPEPDSGAQEPTPESPQEEELPLDQVFEILKNSRRRETLQYLAAHDDSATLSDVAEHIAALENDTTVRAISSTQRKRVYVGLYQCHLPKMDDMGVVDFDKDRGTIELCPPAEQLYPYLEDDDSRAWHMVYLAVALVAAGLLALTFAGNTLSASLALGATVVLVTACSIAHALLERER